MLFDGGGLPAQLADDPREGNTRCGADQPLAMMEGDFGEPPSLLNIEPAPPVGETDPGELDPEAKGVSSAGEVLLGEPTGRLAPIEFSI